MLDDADVERILVVMAHPDDVDFGSAGTVASWVDRGIVVTYVLVTDGDAGGFDETPREQMPVIRRQEQRDAAEALGVTDVHFLGYPDGRLTVSHELRRDIARMIRRVRPQRVLCPSPQRHWLRIGISHPDHLAAGEATLCAVYPDARNPFAHPELLEDEGLEPWAAAEVWMSGSPTPNHHVDVTDTFDRKIKALRRHASQTRHMDDLEAMVRGWLSASAQSVGLPDGRLAELFQVMQTA